MVSILRKLFGQKIPDWAGPLSFEEYQEFQDDVIREVQAVTSEAEFLWEEGRVKYNNGAEAFLYNLVAMWKERQGAARRNIVRKAIAGMIQATEMPDSGFDFDKLALRVYDFEGLKQAPFVVKYPIGEHLAVVLVQDLPDSVATVQEMKVAESGKTTDELYEIARVNMMKGVPHKVEQMDGPPGPIWIVSSEVFGGAYIATLDQMTEKGARYLVASPTRDLFLFFRPNEWNHESAEKFLAYSTQLSKTSARHYIYPFVLEYCDGEYRDLCEFVGGEVRYCQESFNE